MRLIDAERLETRLLSEEPNDGWDEFYEGFNRMKGIALNAVDASPTIDAVPVVRGEWERMESTGGLLAICSACKYPVSWWHKSRFCPSCGAKLLEG